jgi:hypothetical protein
MNIIVVKPSHNARNLDSFEQIIAQCRAVGFRGKFERVSSFQYIIITDGISAVVADIDDVQDHPSNTIARVDISFRNPRHLDANTLDIRWSSSNVRYRFFNFT